MKRSRTALAALLALAFLGCGRSEAGDADAEKQSRSQEKRMQETSNNKSLAGADTAVFGAGCFWCVEAVFQRLEGVSSVEAGYAGGTTDNPTYEQVCTGGTGHAEVARIVFDPEEISFDALLDAFWQAHDPTTLNRQGADAGTQYRSAIFYQSEEQRIKAEASRSRAQAEFADPIVTEISRLERFFPAENYHQDYYNKNRNAPYCQFVIRPKLKKLNLE
jgi:peptide-methionine (S)-S-oxide reductase